MVSFMDPTLQSWDVLVITNPITKNILPLYFLNRQKEKKKTFFSLSIIYFSITVCNMILWSALTDV